MIAINHLVLSDKCLNELDDDFAFDVLVGVPELKRDSVLCIFFKGTRSHDGCA